MSDLTTGIAQAIGAASGGVAGLKWSVDPGATGVNVFEDDMPPEPDTAVGVYSSGGLGEADSSLPFDSPTLQIIVRCGQDPEPGRALWWAIYSFLHAKRYTTLPDGTFLAWAIVQQPGPTRLGQDESNRHRFSMNVRCEVRRASTYRPPLT